MEIFINKLIEFNNYPKNHRNIFNPWNTTCAICDIQNASEIRCKNLETYLQKHEKAKYILIAESPSTGARFTGIPMTSEKVIKKYGLVYQCTSKNNRRYQKGENTACKVWKTIGSENKNFVFWNAFAFNINEQKIGGLKTLLKKKYNPILKF